ncbi:hypothetical protein NDU88_004814 [Pleurodeles waltl]|uniref:Uncharacterized protein n=1 Tax=Pleurodeles waltl TaxID=8319 RepID=A0AAV7PDX6_PLEWA|nr:hypothetical protein NDU88_004814 [Pleurodeles waltl]
MGAAPDAWDSDFRVPGTVKRDDGLEDAEEESSEATDSRGGDRVPEDAAPTAGEDETGKPELHKVRTRLEERASPQETSDFRHVPGGTWLNKRYLCILHPSVRPSPPTYLPFRSFVFRYTWASTSSRRQSRGEPIKNTERETLKKKAHGNLTQPVLHKFLNKYHRHLK